MRLTDGKKIVDVQIRLWCLFGSLPDASKEFFECLKLEYDQEKGAYVVEDLDCLINSAQEVIERRNSASEGHIPPVFAKLIVEEVEQ